MTSSWLLKLGSRKRTFPGAVGNTNLANVLFTVLFSGDLAKLTIYIPAISAKSKLI